MNRTILAAAIAAALTAPAYAWDNTNTGSGQIVDQGGAGAQATGGRAISGSSATSGAASHATGGSGGSSTSTSGLNVQGGLGNVSVSGGAGRAPDVFLPSLGGGGMDCPVVGIGAGGSGMGGGGGIGPTWISPDCNARKLAELLWRMGRQGDAIAVLRDQYPILARTAAAPAPADAAPVAPAFERPRWCGPAGGAVARRNPLSCGS